MTDQSERTLERHVASLEEEQRLRAQFISVLAHDLRCPLHVALVTLDVLRLHPERAVELSGKVADSIKRAERMIRDLLDANRIHAGEPLPVHLSNGDLCQIVASAIKDLRSIHGDRFTLAEPMEVLGYWDSEQLQRAIWNLGTNAVKYGDPGVPVVIRCGADATEATVAVHNEGPPVSPEVRARLFDPFRMAPGNKPGWGLGLTLVRACAEAHHGRVEVDSAHGRGTTFTITLPRDARP